MSREWSQALGGTQGQEATGQKLMHRKFYLNMRKNFFTGTDCPERMIFLAGDIQELLGCNPMPRPLGWPCLNKKVGPDNPPWFLPTWPILWFCNVNKPKCVRFVQTPVLFTADTVNAVGTKCFCRKIDSSCNLKGITELLEFLFLYSHDILHCQLHIWHRVVSTFFHVCKMPVAPDNNGKAFLAKLADAKHIVGTKTSKTS